MGIRVIAHVAVKGDGDDGKLVVQAVQLDADDLIGLEG